jgi:hypothetical protein
MKMLDRLWRKRSGELFKRLFFERKLFGSLILFQCSLLTSFFPEMKQFFCLDFLFQFTLTHCFFSFKLMLKRCNYSSEFFFSFKLFYNVYYSALMKGLLVEVSVWKMSLYIEQSGCKWILFNPNIMVRE